MLKILGSMTVILRQVNSRTFLVNSALLLDVAGAARALVDEYIGEFRTHIGTHIRSDNGRSAWEALYDTTS
jgi:hypothetical protein